MLVCACLLLTLLAGLLVRLSPVWASARVYLSAPASSRPSERREWKQAGGCCCSPSHCSQSAGQMTSCGPARTVNGWRHVETDTNVLSRVGPSLVPMLFLFPSTNADAISISINKSYSSFQSSSYMLFTLWHDDARDIRINDEHINIQANQKTFFVLLCS